MDEFGMSDVRAYLDTLADDETVGACGSAYSCLVAQAAMWKYDSEGAFAGLDGQLCVKLHILGTDGEGRQEWLSVPVAKDEAEALGVLIVRFDGLAYGKRNHRPLYTPTKAEVRALVEG